MKKIICALLIGMTFSSRGQSRDSLMVYYYEDFPYAYMESGTLKGIEVDIMREYVSWLKQKKNIDLSVSYKPFKEFSTFYSSVKDGGDGVIGLGSVTANAERENEVMFSPPYLRNVAVLITSGRIATIKNKTPEECAKVLAPLTAVGVKQSSHITYLNEIKKSYLPGLKITYVESQNKVLENILSDNMTFGYVDVIAFWSFLKNNSGKFLKIQKVFSEPKEYLGFIMPKKSKQATHLSEFFESGFGFTSTRTYHQILEKYLGYEVLESVEIE